VGVVQNSGRAEGGVRRWRAVSPGDGLAPMFIESSFFRSGTPCFTATKSTKLTRKKIILDSQVIIKVMSLSVFFF
jgi:hypothetical protein